EVDALVAYVHAWAGDELLDLLLALAAERAFQQVPTVTDACHPDTPLHGAAATAIPAASSGHVPRGRQELAYRRYRLPGPDGHHQTPSTAREGRAESSRLRRHYLDSALAAPLDHGQNVVDETVFLGFLGGEELIPLDVAADLLLVLAGVPGQDDLHRGAHPQDFPRPALHVTGLAVAALGGRLVDEDPGVGQRHPLALGARREYHRGRRGRLPDAADLDVGLAELHRVVDRHPRRHR